MHTHLAGNMSQYLVPVFELHPKHGVGQRLKDGTFKLDNVFLSQKRSSKQIVLKQQRLIISNEPLNLQGEIVEYAGRGERDFEYRWHDSR